jgi:hypothetical protein
MNGTGKIIYRPPGRTDEILMYQIEDFAGLVKTSRREVDRRIEDGEIEKVKFHNLTCIPAEFLSQFPSPEESERERPELGQQQARGAATSSQAEAHPQTPWEELSYEAL